MAASIHNKRSDFPALASHLSHVEWRPRQYLSGQSHDSYNNNSKRENSNVTQKKG
jgi:hypothetical protein